KEGLQLYMFLKINASKPIPFIDRLFGAPAYGFMRQALLQVHKGLLRRPQEFVGHLFYLGLYGLYVYAHRPGPAYNSGHIVPAMGNGKMKAVALQVRLAAVHNTYLRYGKIGEQLQQQV